MNIFNGLKIRSLKELILTFSDEQKCINFLEEIFWNGNPVSPFDKTQKFINVRVINTSVRIQVNTSL